MILLRASLAMVLLLVTTWWGPAPAVTASQRAGYVVFYRPGLMQRVYAVRVRQGLARPGFEGDALIATPYCSEIGKVAIVRFRNPHTGRWSADERALIVDCSAPKDYARHIRNGLLAEADYGTAVREGFASEGKTQGIIVRVESR